jgi:hypothetical protein
MLNDGFAHSTALRVRRIVDTDRRTISLLRLLGIWLAIRDCSMGKLRGMSWKMTYERWRNQRGKSRNTWISSLLTTTGLRLRTHRSTAS